MSKEDNSLSVLKLEYQACRSKIDDMDNFLKDIRFKGVTIVTGFIGVIGSLISWRLLDAAIIMSIPTIFLIFHLWTYDHKYNMILLVAVIRAEEIETELGNKGGKGEMLSFKASKLYRILPKYIRDISSPLYTLLSIMGLGILIYLAFLKQNIWISALITLIFIISVSLISYLWKYRRKIEKYFKDPSTLKL